MHRKGKPGAVPDKRSFKGLLLQGERELNKVLFSACLSGNLAMARDALDKGAHPDARDRFGRTPLMIVAMENFDKIGELLLERGADKAAQDKRGTTAISYAGMFYNKRMIRLLEKASAA